MTKELCLLQVKEMNLQLKAYIIAEEIHQDGSPHLHVYIETNNQLEVTNPTFFDIVGIDGTTYHGNYQAARSSNAVMKYCQKDGNYLAHGLTMKKLSTPFADAIKAAKDGNLLDALEIVETGGEKTCRDRLLYAKTLRESLRSYLPKQPHSQARDLSSFGTLFNWDRARLLLLHGETNLGKTTLAVSLLPNSLLTRHLDLLASSDTSGGIVFDDMSFHHLHDEAQIAICDTAFTTQVHVRYHVAEIKEKTPRILTTNKAPYEVLNLNNPAIARRVQVVHMKGIGIYEEQDRRGLL